MEDVEHQRRERALNLLVSLRAMVKHPNTPEHERSAAQARIDHLEAKYGILKPKPMVDAAARARAAAAKKTKERAAAAEAYRKAHDGVRDHDGMTAWEREWARRDPLGFAQARDGRTQAEKQRDMQDSFGQRDRPRRKPMTNDPWVKKCVTPVTYFDPGGIARSRNTHRVKCDRCHVVLDIGEGCVTVLGTFCCEATPGPRKKRPDQRD